MKEKRVMNKVKEIIAKIVAPVAVVMILAVFSAAIESPVAAQEKARDQRIDRSSITDSVRIGQPDRRVFCQQKISDLSIIQQGAGRYEFQFHTACSTPVTIEFSEQPPVSLSPPRFKKLPYDPSKPLVPV